MPCIHWLLTTQTESHTVLKENAFQLVSIAYHNTQVLQQSEQDTHHSGKPQSRLHE